MAEVTVFNMEGAEVGKKKVDLKGLGARPNMTLMGEALIMYEANARQGSACTKRRSDIQGSMKKIYKQKGTGHARFGTKKTNIWRGGAAQFGPRPRDYSYSMPRKKKRSALRSALLAKFLDKEVLLLEKVDVPEKPRTRIFAGLLDKIAPNESVLFVLPDSVAQDQEGAQKVDESLKNNNQLVYKSLRNIKMVRVSELRNLNTYDVLRQNRLVVPVDVLDEMLKGLSK